MLFKEFVENVSIPNIKYNSQGGAKISYKNVLIMIIITVIINLITAWTNPDLIINNIFKTADQKIKFFISEIKIDLDLDDAIAIHNIKILAVSEDLDLELCNDASLSEFHIYSLNYDSILGNTNDAEIISTLVEDVEIRGANKKYILRFEIKSKCITTIEYAGIIGNNKKAKIGHFKICIPYLNGTERDSSVVIVPIVIRNIDNINHR